MPAAARPNPYAQRAVDLALVALALALRLFRADAQSLWYDEGTSAALAGRSWSDILVAAANDVHPPLYYLVLAGWTRLFGDGVVAMRGLSALAGALTVAALLAITHRLLPERPAVAWLAAFLAATSPFLVWYGQEVRMYALVTALGAGLLWWTLRVWQVRGRREPNDAQRTAGDPRTAIVASDEGDRAGPGSGSKPWRWLVLSALTLACLYTHYVSGAAAVLAANLVAAAVLLSRRRATGRWPTRPLLAWTLTQTAALVLFLPWLAYAWPTLSAWPAVGAATNGWEIGNATLRTYTLGIPKASVNVSSTLVFPLLLGVGLFLAARRRELRAALGLALAWAAAPALLISLLSLRRATWKPKFVLVGAPGFELLLALSLAAIGLTAAAWIARRRPDSEPGTSTDSTTDSDSDPAPEAYPEPAFTTFIALGIVAACLLLLLAPRQQTLRANYFDPAYQRDDYRGAIADIVARAGPNDAVLLVAPTQVELFDYYAPPELARYPLPLERPPSLEDIHAELDAITAEHRDLHALLYAEREADPRGLIEAWLDIRLAQAYDRWRGDVRQALWTTCGSSRLASRLDPDSPPTPAAEFGGRIGITSVLPHFPPTAQPGDTLCLDLTWIPLEPLGPDVHVFWQLLDDQGRVAAQRDDMAPRNGRANTSAWGIPAPFGGPQERQHPDRLALALPLDLAPGTYQPIVGLYDPATGARLNVTPADGAGGLPSHVDFTIGEPPDHLRLPTLTVTELPRRNR